MGAETSKTESSKQLSAGHLTKDELTKLIGVYNTISPCPDSKGQCPSVNIEEHCKKVLDPWLSRRLIEEMTLLTGENHDEPVVPLGVFTSAVESLIKAPVENIMDVVWDLVTSRSKHGARHTVQVSELLKYGRCLVSSYIKLYEKQYHVQTSWCDLKLFTEESLDKFSEFIFKDLLSQTVDTKDILKSPMPPMTQEYTKEQLVEVLRASPHFMALQTSCVSACFQLQDIAPFVELLPRSCLHAQRAFLPDPFSILDFAEILLINSHIPIELRSQWRFLFSTKAHGESFAKFYDLCKNHGSSVIIIKDERGRVFGGFASDSWCLGPKFYGNPSCFLFSLEPKFRIYTSTGFNSNFQYINVQQETMPNGLGMGGRHEYFGLWIDAEFGKGKCAPSCTTFHCPQMSESQEFQIQHMEVWGVGPEPKPADDNERQMDSILEKDPEAQAMMELIDKGLVSEAYREKKDD